MPKRAQNIISWQPDQGTYLATDPANSATRFLTQEDIDWQKWLAEHDAFAFMAAMDASIC